MIEEGGLPFPTHRGLKPGALSDEQTAIAAYMYARHRGHANAILRVDAAAEIGTLPGVCDVSPRRLREQVAKLVRLGIPIGVAQREPCGYFWIETEDERKMVRDPLLNMAFSTLVHARAFDRDNIVAPILAQLRAAGFDVDGSKGA